MKIRIAYYPEETPMATLLLKVIRGLVAIEKSHETENYPPLKHIYVTTKKPENPCGSKENA